MGFLIQIAYSSDPYLEDVSTFGRLHICCAFMHAVRRGDFGETIKKKQVKGDTERSALDNVEAAFVTSGRVSPVLDTKGQVHTHIERQTRG